MHVADPSIFWLIKEFYSVHRKVECNAFDGGFVNEKKDNKEAIQSNNFFNNFVCKPNSSVFNQSYLKVVDFIQTLLPEQKTLTSKTFMLYQQEHPFRNFKFIFSY